MQVRVRPRFWALMIVAMLTLIGVGLFAQQLRYNQVSRQLQEVTAYRNQLRAQAQALSDTLDFAQTDDYVERVARDELGLLMPGEVRYVNGAR